MTSRTQGGMPFVKEFYGSALTIFPAFIGSLVRLLYYVNLGPNNGEKSYLSSVEIIDHERQKSVLTFATCQLLLLLLRAFRRTGIMSYQFNSLDLMFFEYICMHLTDNNLAILILKMLSVWFPAPQARPNGLNAWLRPRSTPEEIW